MKILFVASYKEQYSYCVTPFIWEQAEALRVAGVGVDLFTIKGRGLKGYLKQLPLLKEKIKESNPDVVHAHYGLSGLLANLQRMVPVVTTYHGSDINDAKVRLFSKMAIRLSAYNLFVSKRLIDIAKPKNSYSLLPCGINIAEFTYIEKEIARLKMGLLPEKRYVLFAGSFDNWVKNAPVAKEAVALLPDVEMLELKGYSRKQVTALLYAVDAFLMTSFSEGSPQVIKEAMACGCPIVSVDVGDVPDVMGGTNGCYIAECNPNDIAEKLRESMSFSRTDGRDRVIQLGLDNKTVAGKLVNIYDNITKNK